MNEPRKRPWWRPNPVGLIAGGICIAGFLLSGIDWGFIALVGVGTFGPGILRELGWLKDKDEFQMEAQRRAGYHGFLAAGLVAFMLTAYYRSNETMTGDPGPPVELILAVLWFTWLLSSLLAYWGAQKMATRILLIFGVAWLVFALASAAEDGSLIGYLMGPLVTTPFFGMAWAARRWPRIAGMLLVGFAAFFVYFFGLYEVFTDPFGKGRSMVIIFFMGPLLTAGIALLRAEVDKEDDQELAVSS